MHDWGDDWFEQYGDDLYRAQRYIYDFTKRWSLCRLCSKEKYGTIRYEWIFPPYGGIYWNQWYSRWWTQSWIYRKWCHFGAYICGVAVKKAVKRWPHLETELCSDFSFNTKFGQQCEDRYWH